MKTFNCLKFNTVESKLQYRYPNGDICYDTTPKQVRMEFQNGFGVSVIGGGYGDYGDGISTFEVGILYKGEFTHLKKFDYYEIKAYQTPEQVTEIMEYLQNIYK